MKLVYTLAFGTVMTSVLFGSVTEPVALANEKSVVISSQDVIGERANDAARFAFTLSQPLPMPSLKTDGRGIAIENLVPAYAKDYENDPYLKQAVIDFRRWKWTKAYQELDALAKRNPDYLNTYRLQAEMYMINKDYKEALSQLDQILRRAPQDIQALAVTALIERINGNESQEKARLSALSRVSSQAAADMVNLLAATKRGVEATYGRGLQTDMIPDVIAVFGQSTNADGTPSKGLLARLEKTKEMAKKFPQAKIVLSGGPVKTRFAEADVMKSWLIQHGIDQDRLLLDDVARDTPGNAMGMLPLFKAYDAHHILAVGTLLHLPRAVTVLQTYADHIGYPIKIDSAGGGITPTLREKKTERLYTYVNAARAGGLFTWSDFEKYSHSFNK